MSESVCGVVVVVLGEFGERVSDSLFGMRYGDEVRSLARDLSGDSSFYIDRRLLHSIGSDEASGSSRVSG